MRLSATTIIGIVGEKVGGERFTYVYVCAQPADTSGWGMSVKELG